MKSIDQLYHIFVLSCCIKPYYVPFSTFLFVWLIVWIVFYFEFVTCFGKSFFVQQANFTEYLIPYYIVTMYDSNSFQLIIV